jgi:ATP-binding cassette subfamily F protein uup
VACLGDPRVGGRRPAGEWLGPGGPGLTGAAAHAARKELARIEARLARVEESQVALHEQMAAAHTDHVALGALAAQDAALGAERTELEERWLELSETLEG